MVATVTIVRHTGASSATGTGSGQPGGALVTKIDGTTDRASTSDTQSPGTANPIPVPADASTNYSFWVATKLSATAVAATAINNIKWYTDGTPSMGTGVALNVATASNYIQATGTTGTTGNQLTSSFYNSSLNPSIAVNAFSKSSSAPISVNGSIGTVTGNISDFVVYQVAVLSTAGPGVTPAEVLTWTYDQT